jgi:heptosyltransferase-3
MPESVVNVAGTLSLAEVASIIAAARVFVGPDTAVTHLAAATGTPTVALYGPTNPLKWGPWPAGYAADDTPFRRFGTQRVGNVLLLQAAGACVPCHEEGCDRHKESRSRCLDELSYARTIAAVEEMLAFGRCNR